ncbi:YceI family protein [bacterium AH-315-J23]|nr:YceI family protein [bacterium AH-315-J23]
MRMFKSFLVFLGIALAACDVPDIGPETGPETVALNTTPWHLVSTESRIEFISVKKGTIVEIHIFSTLSGTINIDGQAVVSIALDSVETNIDIRNERMREHLFETTKHPLAIISAQLDKADFAFMDIGDRKHVNVPMSMNIHGKNDIMDAALIVTRLGDNKVMVESQTSIILDIETFGFQDGVEKLRALAKLPSITPEIPVMFSLVFERG